MALPLGCWIVDGKRVRPERIPSVPRRLARDHVDAAFEVTLPPLTNVRLRLRYPGAAPESGDLYGKVGGEDGQDGTRLTRIRFTSVDPEDRDRLARLLESASSVA